MQKNVKIVLVILLVIICVLLVDTLQAKVWDNRPIFKVTESKGDYQRDNGILVYTYIFTDNTKKTVFKWEKYAPPVNIKNQVFDEYSYMENEENFIAKYNKMVDEIDESIFLKDFENYNVDSDEIKITENEAIEIAKKGFEEYEERHRPSPIIEADLTVEIKDVMLDDFFARKYGEASKIKEIKMRKAYVVTKYDGLDGLSIYVDVTTGLIIGLRAFGV